VSEQDSNSSIVPKFVPLQRTMHQKVLDELMRQIQEASGVLTTELNAADNLRYLLVLMRLLANRSSLHLPGLQEETWLLPYRIYKTR
jgi:hypothetical protein